MMSVAGPVTFPKNTALREAAPRIPEAQLLVETDAPYLAPVPMRGKRNQPAFVAHTLEGVAALRGVGIEHLDAVTTANAARIFGW
jgi:TatD DNase family protein